MPQAPTPFHQQAEEIGSFLRRERAREAELDQRPGRVQGPSENTD
jgi:hypothetical protein